MERAIQLVAFNIPYPPDYGGVIDIFYKIKALSQSGLAVYLHCFEYERPRATELEKYCAKIYYYKRKKGLLYQLSLKPYIVVTRANEQLISNLSSNKAPILFEGIHTCYYLDHPAIKDHLRLVRTHNIEYDYYRHLYKAEKHFFKRLFFRLEAWKLKRYEPVLRQASHILCISPNDYLYFNQKYGHSQLIPAFHPFGEIMCKPGRGKYLLFHGNLSVAENVKVVEYLLDHVLNQISIPVIIAGKNPAGILVQKIQRFSHIKLFANPNHEQMEKLIEDAHICLIPTFQDTGIKLKLLASLFSGRFCIANSLMINQTGLEHLCHRADTSREMIESIETLFAQEFTREEIEKRKGVLEKGFSNERNAGKMVKFFT